MDYITFSWIDYALFIFMFGLSGAVGVYFGFCGKRQDTTNDYLLGGKNMKVFPVSMSLVASTLSGITLLGIPAEVYIHGTQYSMMAVSVLFMGIINVYIFMPVFHKLQLTSAYEYLEIRFGKKSRTVASILYTFSNFIFMPVIIYAPSLAFNQVTGFDLHIIATIMSIVCIFYTSIGGLKAVVWTDTLQFCVTLCTLGCVLVMGTISVGGLANIWEKAELGNRLEFFNMDPTPTVRNTFWAVVIGDIFSWTCFIATNPSAVQRFMAVPTLNDSIKALIIFIIFTIITKTISCFSGLIMYAKYFDCDPLTSGRIKKPDQILPFYVQEFAESLPGLSGLFVAGLFSTALSTLSTFLNTLSGILYTDFISPFMPENTSEKRASTIMKVLAAIAGLLSVVLVFVVERLGSVLELMLSLNGIAGGPVLGLFILGMLFPFVNKKSGFCGIVGSLIFMCFVIIKTQIHIWNGAIKHASKPLYTYGCNITVTKSWFGDNSTTISSMHAPVIDDDNTPFWLFRISFHYYFLMGAFATVIIGLIASLVTRNSKRDRVNPDLLSPLIHRFVQDSATTTRYESVEKELNNLNKKEQMYIVPEQNKLL